MAKITKKPSPALKRAARTKSLFVGSGEMHAPSAAQEATIKVTAAGGSAAPAWAEVIAVRDLPSRNPADEDLRRALTTIYNGLPDGMYNTPQRFLKYLQEFNQPYNAREILGSLFSSSAAIESGIHGMVVQHNIPFRMICEHHLLPALGKAALGYIPHKRVVGLSKIPRLIEAVGLSRPTLQELLCEQVTNDFEEVTEARGVITFIQAEHSCMACRGVNTPGVTTSTSVVRGVFRDVPAAREEFFNIIRT